MTRFVAAVLAGALGALVPDSAVAQAKRYPLESLDHLRLHNVIAEPATFQGKRGLRVTATPEAARQEGEPPMLAWIEGLDFTNFGISSEVFFLEEQTLDPRWEEHTSELQDLRHLF